MADFFFPFKKQEDLDKEKTPAYTHTRSYNDEKRSFFVFHGMNSDDDDARILGFRVPYSLPPVPPSPLNATPPRWKTTKRDMRMKDGKSCCCCYSDLSLCVCIFSLPIFRLFFTSLRELIPKSRFITLKKRNDQLEKRPAVRIIVNRSRCKIADRSYFFLFLQVLFPCFGFERKERIRKTVVCLCVCVWSRVEFVSSVGRPPPQRAVALNSGRIFDFPSVFVCGLSDVGRSVFSVLCVWIVSLFDRQ